MDIDEAFLDMDAEPTVNTGSGFACGSICIVDDEPANLTLLGSILSNHGYDIIPVVDGDLAVRTIKTEQPDLVLLDIMISPEVDGYEICKILKADESTQEIPVLFISALDQSIDKVKAFRAGGVDYITKPYQTEEIIARVQTQMRQHQIQKQQAIQYRALQQEISRRKQVEWQLEQTNRQLELLVTIDSLSGLSNRKHFRKHYEQEWKRMVREREPLTIILCDIDGFEQFNQRYGTMAGDLVIQKIANVVKKVARRPGDMVARWGEDEFILLLPRTSDKGGMLLAEKIHKGSLKVAVPGAGSEDSRSVTLSIGVASIVPTYGHPKEKLLSVAAEALTRAKASVENIVCFAESER